MQIKPHQIPHFARQRERIKGLMNECKYILTWYGEEKGSYFSNRFK